MLGFVLSWLQGCSFDYGSGQGGPSAEKPSAVFYGFTHTVMSEGVKLLELKAEKAESYDAAGKTLLHEVSFTEYDRASGEPSASGEAEEAVFYTDTENAEFSGSIKIKSLRDDASLAAEHLSWDGKAKTLAGGLDRTVEIERGDGSWVRGAGFSADARRRSYSYREAVEGVMVTKEEPK
jgi:LPS export ABC transporter protein LptC